jgi:hypothetical protein
MKNNTKAAVANPKQRDVQPPVSQAPRTMSLEKAKKLIRKTSDEHKGLFRRLAK